LVTIHKLGYIMANAGIDQSNVEQTAEGDRVLLLPIDPDNSCAELKQALDAHYSTDLGIVINDSFGRPWRKGVVSVALGSAGLPALRNLVGKPDLYGRSMRVTESAFADQVATAAAMVMGETNEAIPVVHIRGLQWNEPTGPSRDLIRDKSEDMFQ
jgi:coenzyme F420-0:L-glutamate ligase/coenzyme F420-1:gamma-L-glutamate ligase